MPSFKFAMDRPCDARIGDKNTGADSIQLWFSDTECFALLTRNDRRSHSDWGYEQDLFVIYRTVTTEGIVQWTSRKTLDDRLSPRIQPLNYKLSREIDDQYNDWLMTRAIEETLCQTSNSALT